MQCSAIVVMFSLSTVCASVLNINFYGDNHDVSDSVKDCNFQACDQLCRNLGFPGGACVGDRCDCDNFKPTPKHELSHILEDCSYQACDQFCRRMGFPGGACVGDRCDCDHFKQLNTKDRKVLVSDKDPKPNSLETCNAEACDQLCRWLGFADGTCVGDECDCKNFKHFKDLLTYRKAHKVSSCDTIRCDDMCHRLNYAGGMCEDGNCECY